jgi:hypothetical protein
MSADWAANVVFNKACRSDDLMWKYVVPGALLCLLGVVWCLQGLVGKTSSGGMNGHPIWAVLGVVTLVAGTTILVVGKRKQAQTNL